MSGSASTQRLVGAHVQTGSDVKHHLDDANGVTSLQQKQVSFSLLETNTTEVIFSPNKSVLRPFVNREEATNCKLNRAGVYLIHQLLRKPNLRL